MKTQPRETAIPLLVTRVDLADEAILDVIGAHFDNLSWHSETGQIIAVLHTTSSDPIADALDIAGMVIVTLPNARVSGVDPQLVALGDIADRLPSVARRFGSGRPASVAPGRPSPRRPEE